MDQESMASGRSTALPPGTSQYVEDRRANANIRSKMRRDNVSFLVGRVLPTSPGSPDDLKNMRASTPRTLERACSATKESHCMESLNGAGRPDKTYMHKWNKDAEFADTLMRQLHVIRK
eukprot:TRINITY_DN98318_c0_g1_i1.p1 TRINITY_DN98318_c0_g1~~TRINITY_DN98318_c0_g1_i1.p1  ORF type:complete len:119 (-),score=17.41 TRINITY_DN98318_c0_g1_i1:54-410(-)